MAKPYSASSIFATLGIDMPRKRLYAVASLISPPPALMTLMSTSIEIGSLSTSTPSQSKITSFGGRKDTSNHPRRNLYRQRFVAPPSVLPDISPARGEIG